MAQACGLPHCIARLIGPVDEPVTEVRLRAGRPVEVCSARRSWLREDRGALLSPEALASLLSELCEGSLYAWEDQLRQGFFTLPDGSRVGVTGRFVVEEGRVKALTHIGSACLRVARSVPGCAASLAPLLCPDGRPMSALILSPPGLGKTTLLRDVARCFSSGEVGYAPLPVGIADERGELAACRAGVPALDVGPRSDVCDGCPRSVALPMLVRTMASRVIVTDELSGEADTQAVQEASRCGAAVIASAHAANLSDAQKRSSLQPLLSSGVFRAVVELGNGVGEIRRAVAL